MKVRQTHNVPLPRSHFLNSIFGAALEEFGVKFKATASIMHRGNKGNEREEVLRKFFRERLPQRYAVAEGEAVDLYGQRSPQLDIMIYDQDRNFTLLAGATQILAAEALLASIEVKSRLTKAEIEKSAAAARSLRKLRPYHHPLGGRDVGSSKRDEKVARYYHSVFAYDTDLSRDAWLDTEATRLRTACGRAHLIDVVYVLNRGLLNLTSDKGMLEDESGGAITNFYFALLNFIQRESARRPETPYNSYVKQPHKAWTKLNLIKAP